MADVFSDGLMSVVSAAKWLDISRRALWDMMDSGEIPFCYIPGRGSMSRRIPKKALEKWARSKLVTAEGA